jgi:hypothetical protein
MALLQTLLVMCAGIAISHQPGSMIIAAIWVANEVPKRITLLHSGLSRFVSQSLVLTCKTLPLSKGFHRAHASLLVIIAGDGCQDRFCLEMGRHSPEWTIEMAKD